MANIQIFPREILLFKNKKLFFLSLFGQENKIVNAESNLKFSAIVSFLKNLEEISDHLYFEEDYILTNVENKLVNDDLPIFGSIYSKDQDSNKNRKIFNDDIYFSEYENIKDKDFVISFDDYLTLNLNNLISQSSENEKTNEIFNFSDNILFDKQLIENYLFSYEDYNNYTVIDNIYVFKLSINDNLILNIDESIINGEIPKDILLDNIKLDNVKLLVYDNYNHLIKTYSLKKTDNLLVNITNFYNTTSTFDISFYSNYKSLKLNTICHSNNIFDKYYISFCNFNYFDMKKMSYKILYKNNCSVQNYIISNMKNSSCIIRIYFENIVSVQNIDLLFKNHKKYDNIILKYRKNIYEQLINKMNFSDQYLGYCKILDILIDFSNINQYVELQDIYFNVCNKNVNNLYQTGYNNIIYDNLITIDSINLLHKTNGTRDVITEYGEYIGYIDGYTDIKLENIISSDYKSNIYTDSDNATIEFRLKRDEITFIKIYCDYYSETYSDNSIVSLNNFYFLNKKNNFPKYFIYEVNGYTYTHYQSSYTTDLYGNIINYYEMWRYDSSNYFSLIYNITNGSCYLENIENGISKIIDESNVYFIDDNNYNGFYFYYLGDQYYFNKKEILSPKIDIYYRDISTSEFIKYNNDSFISGYNDVDIKIMIQNGNKEKYIIRSICFKSNQTSDIINLNLNNYLNLNDFNLNPVNPTNTEIDGFFYNISCEIKSKYSSDYNSIINNASTCFFNKSDALYIEYNKSNLSATWDKNIGIQYIVLFDEFNENYYKTYFTPFFDINNKKYADENIQGENLYIGSLFYNYNNINNITSKFYFDKVEIITNIEFTNNSYSKLSKADYYYRYSVDGNNWSDFIHLNYFKCFNAKQIEVISILKETNDFDSECVVNYLDSEKYILLNDNNFDSFMHKRMIMGDNYIFRLIKYYNKNFIFGKVKILNCTSSTVLSKITDLYIDDTLYINQSIKVSSFDNIVKLSWINNNNADKYNIKIYIDGNLYENVVTEISGEDNLYSYFLIFDNNFKSQDISYTVSYVYDNNLSEESNHAYFYINNKPTTPKKLGIF